MIPESERPPIIIAGDGTKSTDIQMLTSLYPELDVDMRASFNHDDLPVMMSEISIMYAMYSPRRGNINDGAIPAKMFEAAAHGRPSIVNAKTPMGFVCESERLGATVDWGDTQALASAITSLQGANVTLENDASRERERFLNVLNQLKI